MGFTVTCYDKTMTYSEDDFQEVVTQYCDNLLNSEGNEHNRYLNILCELFQKKAEISDHNGDITPAAYKHSSDIVEYAEKNYYKHHLMKYSDLLQYTYDKLDETYPKLNTETKNHLMEEIVDKAIEISNQAMASGKIPGGLCRVEEKDFDGTPSVLFVEKYFIDELVLGDKNKHPMFKDYLNYNFNSDDLIHSFEKDEILEERA